MRKLLLHIMLIVSWTACNNKMVEKPVWVNKTDLLCLPGDSVICKAAGKNWKATLLSFTQAIPLTLKYMEDGFVLLPQSSQGIGEGRAVLVLSRETKQFYYELELRNQSAGTLAARDYRSPKTVNPDSGLAQQRMQHTVDEWRNILNMPGQAKLFYEDILELQPKAGTYRAQEKEALSSFYVQPGSAVAVELKAVYEEQEGVYLVTAGPLKDEYGNQVADGTLVTFMYSDDERIWRREAALLNGMASIKIAVEKGRAYRLSARVNETISETINLKP